MDKDIAAGLIGGMCFISVTTILPLCIMYLRRGNRAKVQNELPVTEILSRLDRMEVGMESMSAEVERIGEGQRFTTRLLSETHSREAGVAVAGSNNPKRSN